MADRAALEGKLQKATYVAIDFETADREPDSACAVGLVRVENYRVVQREVCLLKPPRRPLAGNDFVFTYYHHISWSDVASAPTFAEAWPRLSAILDGAEFLAAHYAPFDERVLRTCCELAKLPPPTLPFVCTVQVARAFWHFDSNRLPNVCKQLGISLKQHHEPLCDAEACAQIIIAAAIASRQTAAPARQPAS